MTYDAVFACAALLLRGHTLCIDDVVAGQGVVYDRNEKRVLGHRLDPYETAAVFVRRVKPDRAMTSARVRQVLQWLK